MNFVRALLTLALITTCNGASFAKPLEKVSIQFHWLHQFEFAGFYIAKEKGYFSDAGLDVTILPFSKSKTAVVDAVVSNQAQYGVSYSSLVFDFHKDKPVVALAAIFQDSPLVLMTRNDPDIKTPKDLLDKNVMISGDALNAAPIMALLFSHGLLRSDVIRQNHSYNVEDLISKRTDAMTAYISNEPFHMREHGHDYRIFDPKESGLSFYGNFLFSSQAEVQEHPERVKAFVDASLKGWRYAFENIDETIRLIQSKYNEQNKSYESLLFEANALKKLAIKRGIAIGDLNLKKLEKASDAYRLMGIKLSGKPLEMFVWEGARREQDIQLSFSPAEKDFIETTVVQAATTTNWAPFSFVDPETAAAVGIGYDFWEQIVNTAGLQSRVTKFDSFLDELKSIRNKTQDVIYSVGRTKERDAYSLFTVPYARFPLAIATSKDENFIPDPSHLFGRKIAIGRNFTAHKMMARVYPEIDYLPVNNVKDGLQAVTSGEAFAFIDIMPVLAYSINQYGFTNLKISGNTGLVFDLRIMVRDDYPELVSIANKVISQIPSGKKQEILNRWFNVRYEQSIDYQETLPYVIAVLVIAAMIFFWMFQAKQQAQRANRAKSEFLALMSHDLRTPLNAIMGFSDMIRTQTLGPLGNSRYEEYAADIHKSGSLLVNLINDILDLSKIEAGRYELAEETVNISDLIDTSISQCAVLAHPSRIEVEKRIPDNLPHLKGDERVLIQILNNLVSNAIKFSHEEQRVEIGASVSAKNSIVIEVHDTGIGMTQTELSKVLKPFEQADRKEVRRQAGTGLGLYLCHSLMELFSGELKITSTVGVGTTVTLVFPATRTLASIQ